MATIMDSRPAGLLASDIPQEIALEN